MPIRWDVRNNVGIAQIDRPERRNALNAELCADLAAHLSAHQDLGAVVIVPDGDLLAHGRIAAVLRY